ITIPLMKRTGYEAHIAGATEAAASTGGTILPPVMGIAAFVMVALTGIPYATIALHATIPALLYYLNVYLQTHFYARRRGLVGLPRGECPAFWPTLRRGWFYLVPLLIIVVLVYRGDSLARIALYATLSVVGCSWLDARRRMGPRAVLDALAEGTRMGLTIIAVAGPVSVMTMGILLPGTGLKITGMLIDLAGQSVALTIGVVFVIGYILGMGLSVVPAYIILATLAAPGLIRLGVPIMAAHFMVMWWGQASNITPPVALASYVAANIAGASLWRTGMAAVVKGSGIFYIPVLFAYQPGLLLQGSVGEIVLTVGSLAVGIAALSGAVEGYFGARLTPVARGILGAIGAVLVLTVDPLLIAACAVAVAGIFVSGRRGRRAMRKQPA
ncbi:MAG: TRAP transporter permease, partial [Candidatus Rokuibacteriota bacterium]